MVSKNGAVYTIIARKYNRGREVKEIIFYIYRLRYRGPYVYIG